MLIFDGLFTQGKQNLFTKNIILNHSLNLTDQEYCINQGANYNKKVIEENLVSDVFMNVKHPGPQVLKTLGCLYRPDLKRQKISLPGWGAAGT